MKQLILNIWNSPKSTMTALTGAGLLTLALAQQYPTAKWLGVAATVIGIIFKTFGKD